AKDKTTAHITSKIDDYTFQRGSSFNHTQDETAMNYISIASDQFPEYKLSDRGHLLFLQSDERGTSYKGRKSQGSSSHSTMEQLQASFRDLIEIQQKHAQACEEGKLPSYLCDFHSLAMLKTFEEIEALIDKHSATGG
ncbi:MAG: hypothetical protein Q7S68_03865, partial [Deltaproteobacteria bacterium]|nr:hypothetical protein [Deltaproteobacteria bacterium]